MDESLRMKLHEKETGDKPLLMDFSDSEGYFKGAEKCQNGTRRWDCRINTFDRAAMCHQNYHPAIARIGIKSITTLLRRANASKEFFKLPRKRRIRYNR